MKSYENYKDSKLQWIGDIPNHWSNLKIGRSFDLIGSGTTPNTNVDRFYSEGTINWLNTGDLNDCYISETNKKITEEALKETSLRIFPKDSIVIALYGATIGKLGHLKIETTTNQACCVLSNSNKIKNRFLFYYFLASRKYIISRSYGGGQPNISQELIKQLYIPTPTDSEQTQIAAFLDYKTNLIDTIIEKKKQLIALLKEKRQAVINEAVTKGLNPNAKMKNSGVEWLGDIPEGWEVTFLKRYCEKITDGAHFSPKTEFEGKNYISVKDIDEFGNIDLINCKKINSNDFADLQKNGCQPNFNDVLLTKDGTIGRAAIVKDSNDFVTLSSLGIITPNQSKLNSNFLRYYLVSEININQMFSMIAGAALTRLTIDKIKHLVITIPVIEEQNDIVNYLEIEIPKYDKLIKSIETQIQNLQTYRQSLISEAVTGKIDVRDWQPSTKKR